MNMYDYVDFHAWFMQYDVLGDEFKVPINHEIYAHVRCETEKWRDVNQEMT